jgi:hypothetical protein
MRIGNDDGDGFNWDADKNTVLIRVYWRDGEEIRLNEDMEIGIGN